MTSQSLAVATPAMFADDDLSQLGAALGLLLMILALPLTLPFTIPLALMGAWG